ncbi:YceI family protein [Novosphingobium lentum]|uniref:YceI family protein n=1 Tax=Novosphingobium lentum TaxID=145287 RepID=UPI00082B9564|nr:YceI family protein [Novosphingobium lentum]
MKKFAALALLSLGFASTSIAMGVEGIDPAAVPAGSYSADLSHTSVLASIAHMGFTHTNVNFRKLDGHFTYDPAHPEASSLDVTIDTNSLDSGWAARDTDLKGAKFFNVAAFPTMTFHSQKLTKTGATTARIDGQLTVLGVTKPVALAVTFNGVGKGMDGIARAGFSAHTSLKRSDFGMTTFLPVVGDDVAIDIEAEFSKK